MDPQSIERRSMQIIEEELRARNLLRHIPEDRLHVVKRVIHTTADFDFAETLVFSDSAMEAAKFVAQQHPIPPLPPLPPSFPFSPVFIVDTNMIAAGINRRALESVGGCVRCYMSEPETARIAKIRAVTRATISMERAAEEFPNAVYVVGNAPTALLRICELVRAARIHPALVIGVPVGFVNVSESKEELKRLQDTPFILSDGLKGGSTVAVAIVNALLYGASR